MSEYWKSTPKYWCKFCKIFVRDTALEKKQHDATPKHQGNIQRSLRELHKGHEREDREKQRAKDEVARLNGLVSGKSGSIASGSGTGAAGLKGLPAPSSSVSAQATPQDRKRQMEQLAAMGVAVPQAYRKDLSIASEWSTVSERPVYKRPAQDIKDEDNDEEETLAVGAFGVRKRKIDADEEEAQEALKSARKNWGSTLKSYPGAKTEEDNLDDLFGSIAAKKATAKSEERPAEETVAVKSEEPVAATTDVLSAVPDVNEPAMPVKQEEGEASPPIVFKKRKGIKR